MHSRFLLALALTTALLSPSLSTAAPRTFTMGFTDTPHAIPGGVPDSRAVAWHTIRTYGDLAVLHEDGLIPWDAALLSRFDLYPADYLAEVQYKAEQRALLPSTHKVFLYVNIANFERTAIAKYRGAGGQAIEPMPNGWESVKHEFAHPYVLIAFLNHVRYLVERYRPDYIAYGIESNMLHHSTLTGAAPARAWQTFTQAAPILYQTIKSWNPARPVLFSIQVDLFNQFYPVEAPALLPLMSATDVIAVSSYPYGGGLYPDPAAVPQGYLTNVRGLSPSKPFAVAETGWPAENLIVPDPLPAGTQPRFFVPADAWKQAVWVNRVLSDSFNQQALFVNWFVPRDYDFLYRDVLQTQPTADIVRMWRDDGLIDGNGNVRIGMWLWDFYRSYKKVP